MAEEVGCRVWKVESQRQVSTCQTRHRCPTSRNPRELGLWVLAANLTEGIGRCQHCPNRTSRPLGGGGDAIRHGLVKGKVPRQGPRIGQAGTHVDPPVAAPAVAPTWVARALPGLDGALGPAGDWPH